MINELHCPLCGAVQRQAFDLRSVLEFVKCPACDRTSPLVEYRIGPNPQDPSCGDLSSNQRLKPFIEAARVRDWTKEFFLRAWRQFAAYGPLRIHHKGMTPSEFGELVESLMEERQYQQRYSPLGIQVQFGLDF